MFAFVGRKRRFDGERVAARFANERLLALVDSEVPNEVRRLSKAGRTGLAAVRQRGVFIFVLFQFVHFLSLKNVDNNIFMMVLKLNNSNLYHGQFTFHRFALRFFFGIFGDVFEVVHMNKFPGII